MTIIILAAYLLMGGFEEEESEEGDSGMSDEEALLLTGGLALGVGFLVEISLGESPDFLRKLKPSVVSRESMVLYKRIRKNVIRLVASLCLLFITFYTIALTVALIEGILMGLMFLAYVTVFILPLATLASWLSMAIPGNIVDLYRNSRPITLLWHHARTRLPWTLVAAVGWFFLILGALFVTSALDYSPGWLADFENLLLPLYLIYYYLYPPAAFAILLLYPLSYALVFIILYPLVVLALERVVYQVKLNRERAGSEGANFAKLLVEAGGKPVESWTSSGTTAQNQEKVPEGRQVQGEGFSLLYSLETPKALKEILGWFIAIPIILFLALLTYLMAPPFGMFMTLYFAAMLSATRSRSPSGVGGNTLPGLARLIPQGHKEKTRIFFREFLWVVGRSFIFTCLLVSLIILIPVELDYHRISHEPDFQNAFILGVLIPCHATALALFQRSTLGQVDCPKPLARMGRRTRWTYYLLLAPYFLFIFLKFDFCGNVYLSSLFHFIIALLILASTWSVARLRVLDYFSNNQLSRGYLDRRVRHFAVELRQRHLVSLVAILLMLGFVAYPADQEFHFGYETWEYQRTPVPEENFLLYQEDTVIRDEDMSLDTNILIGASVRFVNCSLEFLPKDGDRTGLFVLENGSLGLENCSLTGPDHFLFVVRGLLDVRNSNISRVWGRSDVRDMEGGIELYSGKGEAVFENTTIQDCPANGIMGDKTGISLRNCHLRGFGSDAMEVKDCGVIINNSTIEDCDYGITGEDSDLVVHNTTFRDTREESVNDDLPPVKGSNNTFIGSGEKELELWFLNPVTVSLLFVVTLALVFVPGEPYRKVKEKLEREGGEVGR